MSTVLSSALGPLSLTLKCNPVGKKIQKHKNIYKKWGWREPYAQLSNTGPFLSRSNANANKEYDNKKLFEKKKNIYTRSLGAPSGPDF